MDKLIGSSSVLSKIDAVYDRYSAYDDNYNAGVCAGLQSARMIVVDAPEENSISIDWMTEQRDKEPVGSHTWWMYQAIMEKWRKERGTTTSMED